MLAFGLPLRRATSLLLRDVSEIEGPPSRKRSDCEVIDDVSNRRERPQYQSDTRSLKLAPSPHLVSPADLGSHCGVSNVEAEGVRIRWRDGQIGGRRGCSC